MNGLPETQSAIVCLPDGDLQISRDVLLPELEDHSVLIRNRAMALQPVDCKISSQMITPGTVLGMDLAGEVVALGSKVQTVVPLSVGDKVAAIVHGLHRENPRSGATGQWVAVYGQALLKLPAHMSIEEGASLGTSVSVLEPALFQSMQLQGHPRKPTDKPRHVLVYGGSTATGTMAIQLLKLCGHRPIATCSPKNFDLVKSYGAEEAFDYHSPTCAADIKAYTKNALKYVLDCISEPETMQFSYQCIGRLGGRYTALEPYPESLHTRPNVKPDWVFCAWALGFGCPWKPPFQRDSDPEAQRIHFDWMKTVQGLLDDGLLRAHPIQRMEDGLEGILQGIEMLRRKQVSGKKLVYTLK